MDFKMIPVSNPYIDIKDLRYFKRLFKSKILTDGFFQKKCEEIIKKKNLFKICCFNTQLYWRFRNLSFIN